MKLAVAKKSGKEFIVLEETEVTTLIKDKVSGEEREIKNTTLKRNYEVTEIEEEVKEEVKAEEATTEAEVKEGLSNEVIETMCYGKDVENHIKEIAERSVDAITFETYKDALKYRDNARQAYKENENKFLASCGAYKIAQERVKGLEGRDDNSSLPFALEAVEDIAKDLSKYQEKMIGFYSRYILGWNEIKRFREEEKAKMAEAAKENK